MFCKNICDELYNECSPKTCTNSILRSILDSSVIRRNFHIKSRQNYTTEKGGNEGILLHNSIGTGLYIVCGIKFILLFLEKMQSVTKGRKRHKLKVMILSMKLISTYLTKSNIMEPSLIIEKIVFESIFC